MNFKTYNTSKYNNYLGRMVDKSSLETKLVHDPISFTTFRGSTSVKHKCLSHAHKATVSLDCSIFTGCFPITGGRSPVCSLPCCVFPIFLAVKIPFFTSYSRRFCTIDNYILNILIVFFFKRMLTLNALSFTFHILYGVLMLNKEVYFVQYLLDRL